MKYSYCILPLLLLLFGCGGAGGASGGSDDAPALPVKHVETLKLVPTVFVDVIELSGTIEAAHDVTLSAQTGGTLESLAPLGQEVSRNALLAKLDDDLLAAAHDQAEAQWENASAVLELAQDNFERQEPLFQDSVISALEFNQVAAALRQARAGLRQAEALRNQAREQLDNTEIRAPFAGRVEEHFLEEGEQVGPGAQVIRIVDVAVVRISIGVAERYAGDIEVGTAVRLDLSAYGGEPRIGHVTFAGSAIEPSTRTFQVLAEVDNRDGKLKPEMVARAVVSREQIDNVLVVPRSAVNRDEFGAGVFVVDRHDDATLARRRLVALGANYAGRLVVTSGLAPGEEVVVQGNTVLSDGDRLHVDIVFTGLDAEGVPVTDTMPSAVDSALSM